MRERSRCHNTISMVSDVKGGCLSAATGQRRTRAWPDSPGCILRNLLKAGPRVENASAFAYRIFSTSGLFLVSFRMEFQGKSLRLHTRMNLETLTWTSYVFSAFLCFWPAQLGHVEKTYSSHSKVARSMPQLWKNPI